MNTRFAPWNRPTEEMLDRYREVVDRDGWELMIAAVRCENTDARAENILRVLAAEVVGRYKRRR